MRHGPHGAHDTARFIRRRHERALRHILFRGAFASIVLGATASLLVTHFAAKLGRGPWLVPVGIGAAVLVLWAGSVALSRRLARPLRTLVDVARRIGAGDLSARAKLGWHGFLEARVLADAMRDMAERLEQQVSDQRSLLAGASHELRTPLQHMKLLVELLRTQPADEAARTLGALEREIEDVDGLVGKLLASSRLDFSKLERRAVDGVDLAHRALERAHLSTSLLTAPPASIPFEGDPTLLVRALENLLENARDHGGGPTGLSVDRGEDRVTFSVEDRGPGLPAGEEDKVLEPFFHRGRAGSLGLGLHLVRRIAQAHGGDAFAKNREGGGAVVGFFVRA